MSDPEGPKTPRLDRTPISTLVQFRFQSVEQFLAEYSLDLSPTGIFIRSEAPPEVGAAVYLQFTLADGSKLIEGLGRVARIVRPGAQGGASGFGVEFVDFDDNALALVRRLCGMTVARGGPPGT